MNNFFIKPIQTGSRKTEITRIALYCHVFLSTILVAGMVYTGGTITADTVGWILGVPFAMQGGMAMANAAEHKAKAKPEVDK